MNRTILTAIFLALLCQTATAETITLKCRDSENNEVSKLILRKDKKVASWTTLPPTKYFDTDAQFAWTTTLSGKGYVSFISFILYKADLKLDMSILSSGTAGKRYHYVSYQCVSPLN